MGWEEEAKRQAIVHGEEVPGISVPLMTVVPREEFHVIDIVMASQVSVGGAIQSLVNSLDALRGHIGETAFEGVKEGLRQKAKQLHADAVIGVNFETFADHGALAIMATGTAVRFPRGGPKGVRGTPPPVRRINPGAVLAKAGLPQYIKLFMDKGIKPDRVARLTDLELKALGVSNATHRGEILNAIARELSDGRSS